MMKMAIVAVMVMKPLAADTIKLAAQVAAAEEAGASESVVAAGKAKLTAAKDAQAKRDRCHKVLGRRAALPPLSVNIPALEEALAAAEEAGVAIDILRKGQRKLDESRQVQLFRDAASSALTEAAAEATRRGSLHVDIKALQQAVEAAEAAGVGESALDDAQGSRHDLLALGSPRKLGAAKAQLQQAKQAQGYCKRCLDAMVRVMETAAAALLDADIDAMEAAILAAEMAGVEEDEVAAAKVQLEEVQEVQGARDDAASGLAEAMQAAEEDPTPADLDNLKEALKRAEGAGVDMEVVKAGRSKLGAELFRRGAMGGRRSSRARESRISAAGAVNAMWGPGAKDGGGSGSPPRRSSMQLPRRPSNLA